jgi:hypothetical protein
MNGQTKRAFLTPESQLLIVHYQNDRISFIKFDEQSVGKSASGRKGRNSAINHILQNVSEICSRLRYPPG